MTIVFFVIKKTIGLRVSKEEEIEGLDIREHGIANSYADFMPAVPGAIPTVNGIPATHVSQIPVEQAVPVELISGSSDEGAPASDVKLTKLVIVTRQSKFEELKAAMNAIEVTGMTVTQVIGCGTQKLSLIHI